MREKYHFERLLKLKQTMQSTLIHLQVSEGYIGFMEEISGANTQGETLEETRLNLREAVQLVLEANQLLAAETH